MLSSPYEKVPLVRRATTARSSSNVDSWSHQHLSMTCQPDSSIDSFGMDKKQQQYLYNKGRCCTFIIRFFANFWHSCLLRCIPPYHDESYYEDLYPTQSFHCTFGTSNKNGIWMNITDKVGLCMSAMVWLIFLYSAALFVWLATGLSLAEQEEQQQQHRIPVFVAVIYMSLCAMALACHVKTAMTDPGAVPLDAVPPVSLYSSSKRQQFSSMLKSNTLFNFQHVQCSQCQTYKPPLAHHCRICNRCIARMDHHCPWMNNCIGAGNLKHFCLFLIYTWLASAVALAILAYNYFACDEPACEFTKAQAPLVYALMYTALATLLFTTSMLLNVVYGLMTGLGTVDRLYSNISNSNNHRLAFDIDTVEALSLRNVFGNQGCWTWMWPMDPLFDDYSHVMGYTTRQALLRQQQALNDCNNDRSINGYDTDIEHSMRS